MAQDNMPTQEPETTPGTEPETTPETEPETTPETEPESTPETEPEETPETEPEETPEPGQPVELSSLQTLQLFRYRNGVYSKRRAGINGVRALSQKGTKLITLPPDTKVVPV